MFLPALTFEVFALLLSIECHKQCPKYLKGRASFSVQKKSSPFNKTKPFHHKPSIVLDRPFYNNKHFKPHRTTGIQISSKIFNSPSLFTDKQSRLILFTQLYTAASLWTLLKHRNAQPVCLWFVCLTFCKPIYYYAFRSSRLVSLYPSAHSKIAKGISFPLFLFCCWRNVSSPKINSTRASKTFRNASFHWWSIVDEGGQ